MYRHLLWAGIRPLTMQKGVRATGLKEIQLRPDAWNSPAIKAEVAVRKEGNSANNANPEGLENKFSFGPPFPPFLLFLLGPPFPLGPSFK